MKPDTSDEECLTEFLEYLGNRVTIDTSFVKNPITGNFTHQVLHVSCGDFTSVSQPEPLDVLLRPATAEEAGYTIN